MKQARKKKSDAEGRKEKKSRDEEYAKSSKVLTSFLKREKDSEPSTSESVEDVTRHTSHGSTKRLEQEVFEESYSSESDSRQPDLDKMEYQQVSSKSEEGLDDDFCDPVQQDKPKCTKTISDVIHHQDFGYMKFDPVSGKAIVSHALRIQLVERGSFYFQNSAGPFAQTNNRSMSPSWFTRQLGKGVTVNRSWLVYSPVKGAAFCFSCLLFPSKDATTNCSLETENGFTSWEKPEKITAHENSQRHWDSFITWKKMQRRLIKKELMDDVQLQNQIAKEKEKWQQVLVRVLSCIKCLARQNESLRDYGEDITEENAGNLMEFLKLIAGFDPIMKDHFLYVQQNPGSARTLSPEILNEFIELVASTVREKLLCDIRRAKYYGIIFNSTLDAAGEEHMSETFRYVDINLEEKTVVVKESFLGFFQAHEKDAASTANTILQQLEKDKLPFENCRSQCYDKAPGMSGCKSEVQQRLVALNSKAIFVNSNDYTLNLLGVHAVRHDPEGVILFRTVQAIYVYFSQSARLWERMNTALGVSLNLESETHWVARVEAVKPIHDQLEHMIELLENIEHDEDEYVYSRSEAGQLLDQILIFEFLVLLLFWNTVLAKIDWAQKRLQDHTVNFHNAAQDIQALQEYFLENTDSICKNSLEEGKELCSTWDVPAERLLMRCKMPGATAEERELRGENEMLDMMKSMMDKIHTELGNTFMSLQKLDSTCGFLLDVKELLCTTNKDSLKQRCISMGRFYDTDLDGLEMFTEIMHCQMLLKTRADQPSTPEDLLFFIMQYGNDVFPNLRVGLQLLLTVATSVASSERSLSKLDSIQSYLKSPLAQERLPALAFLSVESEVAASINFEEVIDTFATAKAVVSLQLQN